MPNNNFSINEIPTQQTNAQLDRLDQILKKYQELGKYTNLVSDNIEDLSDGMKVFLSAAIKAVENAADLDSTMKNLAAGMDALVENSLKFADNSERENIAFDMRRNIQKKYEEERNQALTKLAQSQSENDQQEFQRQSEYLKRIQRQKTDDLKLVHDVEIGLVKSTREFEDRQQRNKRKQQLADEEQELKDKKKSGQKLTDLEKIRLKSLKDYRKQIKDQEDQEDSQRDSQEMVQKGEQAGYKMSKNGKIGIQTGGIGHDIAGNLIKIFTGFGKQLDSVVDSATNIVTQYMAKWTYRLEGSSISDGRQIFGDVQRLVGASGVVRQEDVLKKIGEAVDKGIAYNVEQRAFLATVSENIQSTFDAFNSNLTRIIRIQQADSTVARMGMEKALNQILADMYQDTSYLSDVYDQVSDALFEMQSMQGREQAVETEFVIQKWLGSLYSVGASSNAVQQIAQGLGYLGSGNVQALAGNTGLQTLLALASSRAGKDYAELLTTGLTAEDTNDLLKAMVELLSEIADQTSTNKVVTSAYGNVLGLSVSDIQSFKNVAPSIAGIYSQGLSYSQAQGVTQTALNQYTSRLPMAAQLGNMYSNMMFGTGMAFAGDTGLYLMYKIVDVLDKLTGGGPNIDLSYWGIGTDFHITDLIKSGMFGIGILGSLISGAGGTFGATDLSRWGYSDIVTRGTGLSLQTTGGTSYSQTVGSASSSDVEEQSLKEGTEKSDKIESASGKGDKKDVDDLYQALVRPAEKYQVSDIRLNTDLINKNFKDAMDAAKTLMNVSSGSSLNVNISKINGRLIDEAGGLPVAPAQSLKQFLLAIASFIKNGTESGLFSGLGVNIKTNQEESEYTIQDLIDAFVPMLQDENGIPVKIESASSMASLMQDLSQRS